MALVLIKIRDEEDGKLNISLESEPPWNRNKEMTEAQAAGLGFLEFLGATPEDVVIDG